mmetsp:Transcript_45574/g.145385  ORF Transcript_45574/g.145385 Transcript_45574/m.145385 type:complete len:448 (-) Transcript_45574:281-1624(-)
MRVLEPPERSVGANEHVDACCKHASAGGHQAPDQPVGQSDQGNARQGGARILRSFEIRMCRHAVPAMVCVVAPQLVDVLCASGWQEVLAGPGHVSARAPHPPAESEGRRVDGVGAVHEPLEVEASLPPWAVSPLAQVPVLAVEEPTVLSNNHRGQKVLHPFRHEIHECQQSPGNSLSEGQAGVLDDDGKDPELTRGHWHAVCCQDEVAIKRHRLGVRMVLHKARWTEFQLAQVATAGKPTLKIYLLGHSVLVHSGVSVPVADGAMVSGAEVCRVQAVLDQRVPAAWEVTDACRKPVSPVALHRGVVQLPDERQVDRGGIVKGTWLAAREDKQQLVDDLAREAAALRMPRSRAFAPAGWAVVLISLGLRELLSTRGACVLRDVPGAKLLPSIHNRTVVPDDKVDAQELRPMWLRWVQGVRDAYRIPVPVPVKLLRMLACASLGRPQVH